MHIHFSGYDENYSQQVRICGCPTTSILYSLPQGHHGSGFKRIPLGASRVLTHVYSFHSCVALATEGGISEGWGCVTMITHLFNFTHSRKFKKNFYGDN